MSHGCSITADEALVRLREGNAAFAAGAPYAGDTSPERRADLAEHGQHPFAIVVACSDSRVVPEVIFNCGLGDLFVIRVAGNVIDNHQLGSIEYAAAHLGAPLVVVLGHTHCGAVGAAIASEPEGFVATITDDIKAAIGDERDDERACTANTLNSLDIVKRSLVGDAEGGLGLRVAGALYRIDSGEVVWL